MSNFTLQTGTAALMALVIGSSTIAPMMLTVDPAAAAPVVRPTTTTQVVTIPTGATIPLRYDDAEKIVITPKETMPLTLKVAANITNSKGTVLIPVGSRIVGQLKPATKGSQFVASELITTTGKRMAINASSRVISQSQIRQGSNIGSLVQGAALGGAAAAAIGLITGDNAIATEEVGIGAGLGAIGGFFFGRKKVDVVVINPNTDLNVTLRSNLALR